MNPSEESEHLLTNADIPQWSCPRCTLLNPLSLDECELCEFNRSNQMVLSADDTDDEVQFNRQMQDGYQQRKFMIRFEHLNPLVANNVIGSTTTIASSSFVGGLVGGPVGAIIGAAGAAVLDGANRLHYFLNQNNQGSHSRFLVTMRMIGSAMSITMKTSAQTRNMVVQPVLTTENGHGTLENRVDEGHWSQLTPRDLRMLQILFLHVLCDNTIRDEEVLFLSHEELLERVSPPLSTTHGASPECIDQNSERIIVEDAEAISRLEEHQQVCNICLEDFKEGDNMRLLIPCSHAFHTQCVDQWLCKVASCPICKNELPIVEQAK